MIFWIFKCTCGKSGGWVESQSAAYSRAKELGWMVLKSENRLICPDCIKELLNEEAQDT